MSPQGRRAATRPFRDYVYLGVGVVAAVGLIAFAASSLRDGDDARVTAFGAVHGLAVDPQDGTRLFVATHHGLIVGTSDGNWTRVGPEDDLMGFSAHPATSGTFWASGHPKDKTVEYHNLGVRKSVDGGRTWIDLALRGVDFHALAVSPADPGRLWGVYQGKVHGSTDGGATWVALGPTPAQTISVSADPKDANVLYAATATGIQRSKDSGATWEAWSGQAAYALAWARDGSRAYVATGEAVLASTDGGATWTRTSLDPAGGALAYLAVDPGDPRVAYAATYQAALHKTEDGGSTWRLVKPAG